MTKLVRSDNTIVFEHNNQYGLMDHNENIITNNYYDGISLFRNGFAEVINLRKAGIINIEGEIILDCVYDAISEFDENGLARIMKDGKEGLFSLNSSWIIEPHFTCILPCCNNLYVACKEGHRSSFLFEHDSPFISILKASSFEMGSSYREYDIQIKSENYTFPIYDGKWGAIDKNGSTIIPFIYDSLSFFSNGIAGAKKGDKWGVINNKGKEIVQFIYEVGPDFTRSSIEFVEGNNTITYNLKGKITNIRNKYILPRFDKGFLQDSWGDCFQDKDLNLAEHFNLFELIRYYNGDY